MLLLLLLGQLLLELGLVCLQDPKLLLDGVLLLLDLQHLPLLLLGQLLHVLKLLELLELRLAVKVLLSQAVLPFGDLFRGHRRSKRGSASKRLLPLRLLLLLRQRLLRLILLG